ncbi:hypothetical protein C0584_05985 [Candidatus Parcubacteria bacterium]|nr:MAG: hypothetical protein C0584_05985 [Candidatus Parcubacteria bacterium]
MNEKKLNQKEHFTIDPNIKQGLYCCSRCQKLFSAYIPRTYSIKCLNGGAYKSVTRKMPRIKTIFPQMKLSEKKDVWVSICGTELKKVKVDYFINFCRRALGIYLLSEEVEDSLLIRIFQKLETEEFISRKDRPYLGLSDKDIVNRIKEELRNIHAKEQGLSRRKISVNA